MATKKHIQAGDNAATALVEETRSQTRTVLERLERVCTFTRIAVEGNEPEIGTECLLDTLAEIKPTLPALRRALNASRGVA
jgi:hypothetical protein